MSAGQNITSKYEEERLRAAEQSQIVYLQGQIDELRRLIKDQTNKYNLAMDQIRRVEGSVSQVDGILDRHRQEVGQALDGYRRDIAMLRKEVASALIKIEEGIRPIREMQTQIHQLGETRKQDRDYVAGWLVRLEELEQRLMNLPSQLRELDDRQRATEGRFEGIYAADESIRAEVRKVYEDMQVEKQSLRRQAVEAQQLVADVRGILDDHHNRIVRLDEIRQNIDLFAEQLPPQIEGLQQKFAGTLEDIKRIERVSTERFLMNQERLEEVRHQQDERVITLQETDEQHLRQLTAWLERVDSLVHELEQRQSRSTARVESAQREHAAQLSLLDKRDLQVLEALSVAFRDELARVKTEQVEHGESLEGEEA